MRLQEMAEHYQCLLGIGVDWQLDRNLISEIKSEKRMQKWEEEREDSRDEREEKEGEVMRERRWGEKEMEKEKRTMKRVK